MPNRKFRVLLTCLVLVAVTPAIVAQRRPARSSVPTGTLLIITKAEDERRWDNNLRLLFESPSAAIRARAALAAGRIGDEGSVPALTELLEKDKDTSVRSMAIFALGEVESSAGADALLAVLKNTRADGDLRARAVEALGKIAAALPREQEARQKELAAAILEALKFENARRTAPDEQAILFGLTAALRTRPADAGPVIAEFLTYSDPRVRADAGNALARLRLKDGNEQLRRLLTADVDPIVRANAARVLGITEDKPSFDALVSRATTDSDSRVRVSAIRALASLKDSRATEPLLKRAQALNKPANANEILEIATTLGRLLAQKNDQTAIEWLRKVNESLNHTAPEVENAFVSIAPATYIADFGSPDEAKREVQKTILLNWRSASGIASGLGEVAALPDSVGNKAELAAAAQGLLRAMLDYRNSGLTIN
ncbi:MAG TPA: HEAT repeat domain-containing protein, partial [Pyrinomonadaceae bacterium]